MRETRSVRVAGGGDGGRGAYYVAVTSLNLLFHSLVPIPITILRRFNLATEFWQSGSTDPETRKEAGTRTSEEQLD
jgi:hypothetical protein